jgi:hypothetical protein
MKTIIFRRPREKFATLRNYRIYADGKLITKLAPDESHETEVDKDKLTLQAKVDWCGSKEEIIDATDDSIIEFVANPWYKYLVFIAFLLPVLYAIFDNIHLPWVRAIILGIMFLLVGYVVYALSFGRKRWIKIIRK